jgi:hypothetical protein
MSGVRKSRTKEGLNLQIAEELYSIVVYRAVPLLSHRTTPSRVLIGWILTNVGSQMIYLLSVVLWRRIR